MPTQSPPLSIAELVTLRSTNYPPAVQQRIRTLAESLPEPQAREFLDLMFVAVNTAGDSMTESHWQQWQAVLAHVPGLAGALELVRRHTGDMRPGEPCEHGVRITA